MPNFNDPRRLSMFNLMMPRKANFSHARFCKLVQLTKPNQMGQKQTDDKKAVPSGALGCEK